jgi:hypothetical protein
MGRLSPLVAVAALAAAACSTPAGSPFFDAWESAWSGGDGYELARYYHPDAALRDAQPDLEITYPAGFLNATTDGDGRAWLAEWFEVQTQPQQRTVTGLFVDEQDAVAVMTVPGLSAAVLFDLRMEGEAILTQTMLRWRDSRKQYGTPDDRLNPTDTLVADYLAAWAGDGQPHALYADEATLHTHSHGTLSGAEDIAAAAPLLTLPGAVLGRVAAGEYEGPALFVEPGGDPGTVAFVATTSSECTARVAVVLTMSGGQIVAERRLVDAGLPDPCPPGDRWWESLSVPPPVDEQVTGTVAHPDGYAIELVNGTPELVRFVEWGLARFTAAGLDAPPVETVSFAPIPACRDVSGVVVEDAFGSPDLVLCSDAYAVCRPDRATCSSFDVSVRFALLHELGHAWLLAEADGNVQEAFLEATGLDTWRSPDVPWHRRGAERAADTLAWGLIDAEVGLTRFGGPPCAEAAATFEILTGTAPPRTCP